MSDNGDPLCGENELPSNLILSRFCAARGREIQIMNKALSTSSSIKLAFQKLPKHMRRRAMSHNVKRLPRRLREIHMNQMKKSGLPPKAKRPSRKYRRRPYTLSDEFTRRQRRVTWLNTHIWHAKRFHMVEKWGYKLPESGCDRSFRACYRATVKHCLLQDISYNSCVEITGSFDTIVGCLKKITSTTAGLTIAAKSYIGGLREGRVVLFSIEAKKAIGSVDFQWRPADCVAGKRTLWIWIHAAYYKEALKTLLISFNLASNTETQVYSNEIVEVKVLKWELSRLRLTGPLSNAVLQNAFKLANKTEQNPNWVTAYFQKVSDKGLASPHTYWENLKSATSPAEISPHLVLPLIISDPRLNFPKKRMKALPPFDLSQTSAVITEHVYNSPLWEESVRKIVQETKKSSGDLAKLRENLLVPGSDLEDWDTYLPVILVQRPGKKGQDYRGYGSGWDIILPSVWTQPVWLSLIMWGARPGGLRETDRIDFESGYPHCLNPDTSAGSQEELSISDKCKEDFFKVPPNKRTNFSKFRIASPLEWNWKLLLSEWSKSNETITEFKVLRDRGMLKIILEIMSKKCSISLPPLPENCLIPVRITLSQKGSCKKFAIICLPEPKDFKLEPMEPISPDPNETLRKEMRTEHKMLLKSLRRKRIRARKNGKVIPVDLELLKSYSSKMRKLWLPEAKNIRHSCSREVMGYVRHGDFSFLVGRSKALGYITSGALEKLLSLKCNNKVLVRNTNSRQYRLGTLEVVFE
nr:ribonucleases P/MRP protein subunit POP1 [Leptinotarsa decemlineata]